MMVPQILLMLDQVQIWVQIHSIPELYITQSVVDQLARRIRKVNSVDMTHQRWFEGDYVRVRASIDVTKPLIQVVRLNIGGPVRSYCWSM
jgi:hypothetical protein